jgi:hypothetical protein
MSAQFDFGFKPKPRLRLSRIEEILKQARVIDPVPSRFTLCNMCEDGRLDAVRTEFGWLVSEESFKAWIKSLDHKAA